MYRIDDASAAASLPAPEAALTEGFWTEGNPGTGVPATLVRASFLNMVQEELRAIPVAAGLTPSKTTYNQILTALKSMFSSVVGSMRNATMSVTAASATATFTADEIIVETALGGQTFRLASFNKTINLATTGAGGMDTGVAPTSGFVALYAIYNPTTQTSALLATNAATLQPNVYGGANMPVGYTASALVSVWPTNASKQLIYGYQADRRVAITGVNVLGSSSTPVTPTLLSVAATVPANAKNVSGYVSFQSTVTTSVVSAAIAGASPLLDTASFQGIGQTGAPFNVVMVAPQTVYWQAANGSGTFGINFIVSGYSI